MGGMLTVGLAAGRLVDVAVIAHPGPGPFEQQEFDKIAVPVSFICAQGVCAQNKAYRAQLMCRRGLHLLGQGERYGRSVC